MTTTIYAADRTALLIASLATDELLALLRASIDA